MLTIRTVSRLPLGSRILRFGDQGGDVAELQKILAQKGFYPIGPDGFFGAVTDEAVREFQSARHLRCDGIAGPQLYAALLRPENGSGQVYVVQGEHNLEEVARKLTIPLPALARANRLSEQAPLYTGQRLIVARKLLGVAVTGSGRPRTDMPAFSYVAYHAGQIGVQGRLVPMESQVPLWAAALHYPICPIITAGAGLGLERFLRRNDWWSPCLGELHDLEAVGADMVALEVGTTGRSARRRLLRFLSRWVQTGDGARKWVVLESGKKCFHSGWLNQVLQYVHGIILQFNRATGAEAMKKQLASLAGQVNPAQFQLALDITAHEVILGDDGKTVEGERDVPYFEAQARAAASRTVQKSADGFSVCQYRSRGRWRHLTFMDPGAVLACCDLVNQSGLSGVLLRGYDLADSRLYRSLPEQFGLAEVKRVQR